jgi:osmotically-inducible protein OsmY
MIRGLIRLVLVVVLVVGLGAFFLGYRWADGGSGTAPERATGTSGRVGGDVDIDTSRAREAGAKIGESVAEGANEAQRVVSDAGLTAKIKAKMALDDTISAAAIDVDSNGSTVTLSGRVGSQAERSRAVQLARETEGVTKVVDQLTVGR